MAKIPDDFPETGKTPAAVAKPHPVEIDDGPELDDGPVTVTLSAEDLEQVRAEARKAVADDQRKALMKAALAAAMKEERIAAGLEKETRAQKMVTIVLDLPPNVTPVPALVVDSFAYYEQTPYTVTEQTAISLLDQEARAWENEARFNGKWRDPRRPRETRTGLSGTSGTPISVGGR